MRKPVGPVLLVIALACAAPPAQAAEVNFNAGIVGAFPIAAFAEKDGIIHQAPYGWSARGGGAETGFGFNLELETRVGKVTWVGFRFGYVRHGADASGVKDFVNGVPDTSGTRGEITALDGAWACTSIGLPVRFVARDYKWGTTYLKLDVGWTRVTCSYDGVMDEPTGTERPVEAQFGYGNQFFLSGGLGADFRVGKALAVIAEVKYYYTYTRGAEATSTIAGSVIRSQLYYDTQTVEVLVGVRMPLGGI